mmetsp:Transcript_30567/g.87720  ORF Transcript_30567/g.87720 Transcript_30567/m.87720 type:complete len:235 (+) Transcript_30567:883-1587(+)
MPGGHIVQGREGAGHSHGRGLEESEGPCLDPPQRRPLHRHLGALHAEPGRRSQVFVVLLEWVAPWRAQTRGVGRHCGEGSHYRKGGEASLLQTRAGRGRRGRAGRRRGQEAVAGAVPALALRGVLGLGSARRRGRGARAGGAAGAEVRAGGPSIPARGALEMPTLLRPALQDGKFPWPHLGQPRPLPDVREASEGVRVVHLDALRGAAAQAAGRHHGSLRQENRAYLVDEVACS